MYILAPSILAADFGNLRKEIQTVSEAGAQYIHIDVMDGMFVPSISFGMPVIQSVRSCTDKVFDVHMMVEEPGRYAADLKAAGADLLCVHQEACRHLDRTINQIKELGMKVDQLFDDTRRRHEVVLRDDQGYLPAVLLPGLQHH